MERLKFRPYNMPLEARTPSKFWMVAYFIWLCLLSLSRLCYHHRQLSLSSVVNKHSEMYYGAPWKVDFCDDDLNIVLRWIYYNSVLISPVSIFILNRVLTE